VNSKLHFLIENGLQNGVVKRGKQTINILCSSEQILELFQKGRMGWYDGRLGQKTICGKMHFPGKWQTMCFGRGEGIKRKVRNIILCKLLLIQAIHNFALTNYLSKLCCCCSPAVESTSSAA